MDFGGGWKGHGANSLAGEVVLVGNLEMCVGRGEEWTRRVRGSAFCWHYGIEESQGISWPIVPGYIQIQSGLTLRK